MHDYPMVPIEVLLVEDNPGDAVLTREALKDGKLKVNLHHVLDGQEAIDFLEKIAPHEYAPTPDIILLDLNMPRIDGRDFLKLVKVDQRFSRIPVVVLTTSKAHDDIIASYDLQAACFVSKPVDFDKFQQIVEKLSDFWFTVVKLPRSENS